MAPPLGPLLARHRTSLEAQRERVARALWLIWDNLPSYDDPALFRVAAEPLLAGAKAATVARSDAFYSLLLDVEVEGVDPADVLTSPRWEGPFHAVWKALGDGHEWEDALRIGRSEVEAMSSTFLQSTARRTGDEVAVSNNRPTRWRRVANPDACRWCLDRSGGIYPTSTAADYGHNRCYCDVVPI